MIRPASRPSPYAVEQSGQQQSHTIVAPVRGWVRNENLAASGPGGAYILDNWFPTQTDIELMGGSQKHATIGTDPVKSQFTYKSGSQEVFFAADDNGIFDVTSPADPDVAPSAEVAVTNGEFSTVQMATSGGDFLLCVNGVDDLQRFDGTNWLAINGSSTPSITGIATSSLIATWTYAKRVFFVEKQSRSAWYLGVDQIAGALTEFQLDGVLQNGGNLLFGATWSLDSGSGLDDKCVFVSDQGEIAIYSGTDPSDASAWFLEGVYRVGKPLGKNAFMQAGGDLLILTEDGIIPVSEAIRKDPAALALAAVTKNIEPEWKAQARARRTVPWQILKWTAFNRAIVALPVTGSADDAYCYVVNLETGAWCRRTGWNTRSVGLYDGYGYYGSNDGTIYKMEVTGADDGEAFTAVYVGSWDHLGQPGATKTVLAARSTFVRSTEMAPKISMSTNYQVNLPAPPSSIDNFTADVWDTAIWDTAVWDASGNLETQTKWVSIGKTGFVHAPQVQVTSGTTIKPDLKFVAFDVTFETGGVMV